MREGDRVIVLEGKHAGCRGKVTDVRDSGRKVSVKLDRGSKTIVFASGHVAVTQHGFADFRR